MTRHRSQLIRDKGRFTHRLSSFFYNPSLVDICYACPLSSSPPPPTLLVSPNTVLDSVEDVLHWEWEAQYHGMLLSITLPLIEPCRILSTEKHTLPEPFPDPLLSTPQTPPFAQICILVDY